MQRWQRQFTRIYRALLSLALTSAVYCRGSWQAMCSTKWSLSLRLNYVTVIMRHLQIEGTLLCQGFCSAISSVMEVSWERPCKALWIASNPPFWSASHQRMNFFKLTNIMLQTECHLRCVQSLILKLSVAQLHWTLFNPLDCSLPDSSVHGILQAQTLEVQPLPSPGDLPNTAIKPRSSHCRQIPYHLSHQEAPIIFKEFCKLLDLSVRSSKETVVFPSLPEGLRALIYTHTVPRYSLAIKPLNFVGVYQPLLLREMW